MKNRMAGSVKKFSGERQQVWRPPTSRHDHGVAANSMSIFQHNSRDTIVMFIKPGELRAFAQIHPARSRIFDERRDNASTLGVACLWIKEAVMKAVFSKSRKALVERKVVEWLE